MEVRIQEVCAVEVGTVNDQRLKLKQDRQHDLLLKLSCLANRVLSSSINDILSVLLKHMGGGSEVSFATIAQLVVVEKGSLGCRREGMINRRGGRWSLNSGHVGWSGNRNDGGWGMVLNRQWRRGWHDCRWHRSGGSRIVGHAIELVGHPVGLIGQQ